MAISCRHSLLLGVTILCIVTTLCSAESIASYLKQYTRRALSSKPQPSPPLPVAGKSGTPSDIPLETRQHIFCGARQQTCKYKDNHCSPGRLEERQDIQELQGRAKLFSQLFGNSFANVFQAVPGPLPSALLNTTADNIYVHVVKVWSLLAPGSARTGCTIGYPSHNKDARTEKENDGLPAIGPGKGTQNAAAAFQNLFDSATETVQNRKVRSTYERVFEKFIGQLLESSYRVLGSSCAHLMDGPYNLLGPEGRFADKEEKCLKNLQRLLRKLLEISHDSLNTEAPSEVPVAKKYVVQKRGEAKRKVSTVSKICEKLWHLKRRVERDLKGPRHRPQGDFQIADILQDIVQERLQPTDPCSAQVPFLEGSEIETGVVEKLEVSSPVPSAYEERGDIVDTETKSDCINIFGYYNPFKCGGRFLDTRRFSSMKSAAGQEGNVKEKRESSSFTGLVSWLNLETNIEEFHQAVEWAWKNLIAGLDLVYLNATATEVGISAPVEAMGTMVFTTYSCARKHYPGLLLEWRKQIAKLPLLWLAGVLLVAYVLDVLGLLDGLVGVSGGMGNGLALERTEARVRIGGRRTKIEAERRAAPFRDGPRSIREASAVSKSRRRKRRVKESTTRVRGDTDGRTHRNGSSKTSLEKEALTGRSRLGTKDASSIASSTRSTRISERSSTRSTREISGAPPTRRTTRRAADVARKN